MADYKTMAENKAKVMKKKRVIKKPFGKKMPGDARGSAAT